jgi:hypothetical protein
MGREDLAEDQEGDIVAGQDIYEICRYDVAASEETLVDHFRLCNDHGQLIMIGGDGETSCETDDMAALVGGDPRLSEIKPNQITSI